MNAGRGPRGDGAWGWGVARRAGGLTLVFVSFVGCEGRANAVAPASEEVAPPSAPSLTGASQELSPDFGAIVTEAVEGALSGTGIRPDATLRALDEFVRELDGSPGDGAGRR